MKKRVRVYKPGGEAQQPTQEQIIAYITEKMQSDDYDPNALSNELAQVGISNADAENYMQYVSDNLYDAGDDYENTETEDTQVGYAEYGGSKPSKKSFINKYTKFAKMGQGGDTPSPGADDVLNGREAKIDGFQNALKNSANDAILKQEAEAQYEYAYGGAKIGAFEDGGINPEQIDTESPLDHWTKQSEAMGNIFRNNQNIQNDAPIEPSEQFGGFTDTDSGLYKFIGGGDNESADEQYQDADIDFNQEEYANGGVPRRLRNRDLTARGYYSETGERIAAPNTQGKTITSVEYLNKNIFGMPRQVKYNYGPGTPQPATPAKPVETTTSGEYMPPNEFTGRRQPLANFMMRTGIPGVRGLGAKMIKSGPAPVVPNVIPETFGTESGKYNYKNSGITVGEKPINVIPETYGSQRYDFKNNAITTPDSQFVSSPENQKQIDQARQIEKTISGQNNSNITPEQQTYQDYLIRHQGPAYKEYGGPIDYTEYAYGGDISIPELYKAQLGMQTNAFDPNDNPLGLTKDYKGDTVDFTGKVVKKRNPNFSFGEDATKLKNPWAMDENYSNPLTGEKPGVIMNNEGDYTDNGLVDDATAENEDGSFSQVFDVSKRKRIGNGGKNISTYINMGLGKVNEYLARNQENDLIANLKSAESNFGVSNNKFRGTYHQNTGHMQPNIFGSNAPVKYGGGVYAMGGNTMDEDKNIRYMTQAEIDEFRANGGELEFV